MQWCMGWGANSSALSRVIPRNPCSGSEACGKREITDIKRMKRAHWLLVCVWSSGYHSMGLCSHTREAAADWHLQPQWYNVAEILCLEEVFGKWEGEVLDG